jgi:hypothetical protein
VEGLADRNAVAGLCGMVGDHKKPPDLSAACSLRFISARSTLMYVVSW